MLPFDETQESMDEILTRC